MESPEKLYVDADDEFRDSFLYGFIEKHKEDNIEYTRTDAFIERACEWIETNMDDYIHVEYDTVTGIPTNEAHIAHKRVVEDFKTYMKGER